MSGGKSTLARSAPLLTQAATLDPEREARPPLTQLLWTGKEARPSPPGLRTRPPPPPGLRTQPPPTGLRTQPPPPHRPSTENESRPSPDTSRGLPLRYLLLALSCRSATRPALFVLLASRSPLRFVGDWRSTLACFARDCAIACVSVSPNFAFNVSHCLCSRLANDKQSLTFSTPPPPLSRRWRWA